MKKIKKRLNKDEIISLFSAPFKGMPRKIFGNQELIAKYDDGEFDSFFFDENELDDYGIVVEQFHSEGEETYKEGYIISSLYDNIRFAKGMVLDEMIEELYENALQKITILTRNDKGGRIDEKSLCATPHRGGY